MADHSLDRAASSTDLKRRRFLKYLISGATGALVAEWGVRVASRELTLEDLCSASPENSRCKDYLPGVQAVDLKGTPISASALLVKAKPNEPIVVKGLPTGEPTYLVITKSVKIAPYAIAPTCTHLGCTVKWRSNQNRFVCPCHGSEYDAQGRVVQGPARRPLPLITAVVKKDQIRLVDRAPAIDPR